ncbi:MAG: hypothetical protein IKH57_19635 [Clostridia bacterium]|nr:hypothetical protein [Clostridia bacterium]MBR4361084.1 hypothetical protein [Clostridia bacterium]
MNTEKKALLSVSYPYESVSKNQCSTEKNELELYFLILDCLSIHGAIIVYDHICNLNKDSQFILYYNTLEEALIYRIMMGLSKLFENSGKARTCMRVINAIEQKQQFKLNKIIGEAISRIHIIVKQFQETYNLHDLRDSFFGHLDNEMSISTLRFHLKLNYYDELQLLLFQLVERLVDLYNLCFPEYKIILLS